MAQLGRISGGVLADNLLRQGVDLKFANTNADLPNTPLLHLNVNNSKININSVSNVFDLNVPSEFGMTNLVGTAANIADITIDTNQIVSNRANLNLRADSQIFATALATDDLKFDFNTISTTTPNTNIELRPDGTGDVNMRGNWNNTGNIHSTGNITFGGNFVIGDGDQDDLRFEGELTSDLIPDVNDTYNLGAYNKRWNDINTRNIDVETLTVKNFELDGVNLQRRQGNIFYVSTLGNDSNAGDHQNAAFRTIRHALEVADASSGGPVTIHIYAGEYDEVCPLTVPERVTITGADHRNTVVRPDTSSQYEDIFLIQGNVTIENLTIKDFYYNPLTNTGHAFRFVPNGIITERSPYVRNVTVITKGSTISASDPRGYASGDAGKGALIDGSELDFDSVTASMLFHAATFITPGVDAITMTNGVRVEWLNCFTYFANRGLYATRGEIGNANQDSSMQYGAEVRSIGSASVYGAIGAEADGQDVVMYLIAHNLGYIGVGANKENDLTLVNQADEIIQVNNGKIYFLSQDHTGTLRVGEIFYADYETGVTSIDANELDFTNISQLKISDGVNTTLITGSTIDTGNIRISGNTIDTVSGKLIFSPTTSIFSTDTNEGLVVASGSTFDRTDEQADVRLNTDHNIFEGYTTTGNVSFGGIYSDDKRTYIDTLNVGNEIQIYADNQLTGQIVAGASAGMQLSGLSDGDILIDDNTITTTLSNSDLDLVPDGTGILKIDDIEMSDEYIKNLSNNPLVFDPTGSGWVKFDTTTGLRIPTGTNTNKLPSPEIGATRYNTSEEYMEIYNGSSWQQVAGDGGGVNEDDINDLLDLYVLVLG